MTIYKVLKFIFFFISGFYVLSWILLQTIIENKESSILLNYYSDSYGLIALFATLLGISTSTKFGSFKSVTGKTILIFSLGMFFQFVGQLINTYYRVIEQIDAPYPSSADIFYFLSIPIYIYGSYLILKILGAKRFFNNIINILMGTCIMFAMISLDYFLFLKDYDSTNSTQIQLFLDYSYPLLQATNVALILIGAFISSNRLGGVFKNPIILLLFALFIQYLADTTFTYKFISETLYAGDLPDLLYVLAYIIMGLSFTGFKEMFAELKGTKIWTK
jgi:hypothetical protein